MIPTLLTFPVFGQLVSRHSKSETLSPLLNLRLNFSLRTEDSRLYPCARTGEGGDKFLSLELRLREQKPGVLSAYPSALN